MDTTKLRTYPPGSLIRVASPASRPGNWNSEMFDELRGTIAKVLRITPGHDNPERYRYYLDNSTGHIQWSWRHVDLILLELPELEPNMAFRNMKDETT